MLDELKQLMETKDYGRLRQQITSYNEADIASILEEMEDATDRIRIFRLLPKDLAADVFSYLPSDVQEAIISAMSEKEGAELISMMYADDAADFMEELPANVVKRLLAATKPDTRREINQLLHYPDNSAGSIMTTEFIDFRASSTVADAIAKVRRDAMDKETIVNGYVLDERRRLIGMVSMRQLLVAQGTDILGDIMQENVITANTLDDQETVAQIIQKYDFSALPIVDSEYRLVGIVTVDDIVDVLQEEATEDIEKMAAILPTDKPYLRTGVLETWKKRIPWLLLLMVSATFTSAILTHFENALAAQSALIAFIPMLMDTGGNAGGQSSVTIIRGLSLQEIELKDIFAVIWKEIRVAMLCGIALAVANFAKLMLIDRLLNPDITVRIALVVCITLVIAVLFAKIIGCTLPILAKRIGFDPAVMASPFITTIVDAISLLVYFLIASILLPL